MNSAFVTIYGIFVYLTGLVIGFKIGMEFEQYRKQKRNKEKWDQDVH